MKFLDLVRITGNQPVFTAGLLISGDVDPRDVRRQLSRWKEAGKVVQLRKGVYALAQEFRSGWPHPFLVANQLVKASYVSLQSALAFYGMIPENVPVTTSVTTGRPWSWDTPAGSFSYRHLKPAFFHSYHGTEVAPGAVALVATREKALCDLVHLTPGGDTRAWLSELRLQDLGSLDMTALLNIVQRSGSPKLERARRIVEGLREAELRDENPGRATIGEQRSREGVR
jgi:predicted transcriptional regulator of viral defense system